ncbi:histidine kinase [Chitinophaga horti]|uniref:Histidine kinase n=1 Tax=Chitinophaga horti TaxID=2920382 RepID=A0ABY6JAW6_9BACT|nr:histidine kinase [Chitinophaga horti]UYQ95459.1 histidine kinase [Chitinophaga horti]
MGLILLYVFPVLQGNWGSWPGMRYTIIRYLLYGFINFQLWYVLSFVVLPLHDRRKHWLAAGWATGVVFCFCLIKYAVARLFPDDILQGAIAMIGMPKRYFSFPTYFRFTLGTGIAVTMGAYAYYIFLRWRAGDAGSRRLEAETALARRQYAQMHFSSQLLLRKLKAIEQMLANERQPEGESAEAILQLSQLLRYMLYDKAVRLDKAPLEKELQFFHLYLDLHNRLFPQQQVSLVVEGDATGRYIAPLQLQHAAERLLDEHTGLTVVTMRLHIGTQTLGLSSGTATNWLQALRNRYSHHLKIPVYATQG